MHFSLFLGLPVRKRLAFMRFSLFLGIPNGKTCSVAPEKVSNHKLCQIFLLQNGQFGFKKSVIVC
jgi:hypothetical protein